MEMWQQAEGFPLYEISTEGRVRSNKFNKVKYLQPNLNSDGYLQVSLSQGNKVKTVKIHRLVALAFIPNPKNKKTVNHKNGIKTDNRVENLEWATSKQQMTHAYEHKLNTFRDRLAEVGKDTQFKGVKYFTWIHKNGLEFYGTSPELVRAFPEHKLDRIHLAKLEKGYEGRTQHKGWQIKTS